MRRRSLWFGLVLLLGCSARSPGGTGGVPSDGAVLDADFSESGTGTDVVAEGGDAAPPNPCETICAGDGEFCGERCLYLCRQEGDPVPFACRRQYMERQQCSASNGLRCPDYKNLYFVPSACSAQNSAYVRCREMNRP